MIYWVFLLLALSSSAHAGAIPTPSVCKPEAPAGTYPNGTKYWQRTVGATVWKIGAGSTVWIIGENKRTYNWTYGAGHWKDTSLTNCQVVHHLNEVIRKLNTGDYAGLTLAPNPVF
jgi:hypothetical protein